MDSWKLGLTINGEHYDRRDLLAYSTRQIVSAINPWEKEIYRFIINWLSDSGEIVQFSSGTTGKPKEIRLHKESMMQSAQITCDYLKIREGNVALLCMPVEYIAGRMMIVRSMVCGLNLMILEPKSSPDIHTLPDIDFTAMVPLQVINILTCGKPIERIKKLLIGGAEISQELQSLLQTVRCEAFGTYGMAETSSHIAIRPLNGPNADNFYHVLPGVSISTDIRQCLVIRAPWIPNQVVTNDIVELKSTSSFRWLGRFDNLINSGGIKIIPEEVENMVMSKTGKECIAVGLPDPKFGQRLAFVVEDDQVTIPVEELRADFAGVLPRRWKPSRIIVVSAFPRNDALKIDRRKLLSILNNRNI